VGTREAWVFCPNTECADFVGIHGEYVETIWQCPVCGARLVHELPPQAVPEAGYEPEMAGVETGLTGSEAESLVPVGTFVNRQNAELARSMLIANGITAFVSRRELLVPESQLQDAKALLEEAERSA
jgi:hypothetical protein